MAGGLEIFLRTRIVAGPVFIRPPLYYFPPFHIAHLDLSTPAGLAK